MGTPTAVRLDGPDHDAVDLATNYALQIEKRAHSCSLLSGSSDSTKNRHAGPHLFYDRLAQDGFSAQISHRRTSMIMNATISGIAVGLAAALWVSPAKAQSADRERGSV